MKTLELDPQVQQAVDRLLLEQGSYTPLELLLAEGRLLFTDYEAWREGEGQYLDEFLFGDPAQSQTLLQHAADYAKALGLTEEYAHYTPWGASGQGSLQFSPDAGVNRLFHTRYGKPADVPQLDLFMDTTGTSLVNGIRAALIGRDLSEAQRQLDRLFDADPGNSRLGSLEQLVDAAARLDLEVQDPGGEQAYLQQELQPLAVDQLGAGSRDFLAPFWRRLRQAVKQDPFDPTRPELHASYMAIQLEDWQEVQQSIEVQPDWPIQPWLLRRHAQACGRLQQAERAVCDWFRFCWSFPEQARAVAREAEPIWRSRWHRFRELEPELPNQDFPAWSLLMQPAIFAMLDDSGCLDETQVPEDYLIVGKLASAGSTQVPATELINLRRQLKTLNPELFTHYLENFGRG